MSNLKIQEIGKAWNGIPVCKITGFELDPKTATAPKLCIACNLPTSKKDSGIACLDGKSGQLHFGCQPKFEEKITIDRRR